MVWHCQVRLARRKILHIQSIRHSKSFLVYQKSRNKRINAILFLELCNHEMIFVRMKRSKSFVIESTLSSVITIISAFVLPSNRSNTQFLSSRVGRGGGYRCDDDICSKSKQSKIADHHTINNSYCTAYPVGLSNPLTKIRT